MGSPEILAPQEDPGPAWEVGEDDLSNPGHPVTPHPVWQIQVFLLSLLFTSLAREGLGN